MPSPASNVGSRQLPDDVQAKYVRRGLEEEPARKRVQPPRESGRSASDGRGRAKTSLVRSARTGRDETGQRWRSDCRRVQAEVPRTLGAQAPFMEESCREASSVCSLGFRCRGRPCLDRASYRGESRQPPHLPVDHFGRPACGKYKQYRSTGHHQRHAPGSDLPGANRRGREREHDLRSTPSAAGQLNRDQLRPG